MGTASRAVLRPAGPRHVCLRIDIVPPCLIGDVGRTVLFSLSEAKFLRRADGPRPIIPQGVRRQAEKSSFHYYPPGRSTRICSILAVLFLDLTKSVDALQFSL